MANFGFDRQPSNHMAGGNKPEFLGGKMPTYPNAIGYSNIRCVNCRNWDREHLVSLPVTGCKYPADYAPCKACAPENTYKIPGRCIMCEDDSCVDSDCFLPTREFLAKFPRIIQALIESARQQASYRIGQKPIEAAERAARKREEEAWVASRKKQAEKAA